MAITDNTYTFTILNANKITITFLADTATLQLIRKQFTQKDFAPIYFLQGDEPFYIDQIMSYLEKNVLSEQEQAFNLMVAYGKDTDLTALLTAAKRYPMMAKHQVVLLKEAQHLSKDIDRLIAYAQKPPATTILGIAFKNKKIRSNSKLAKAIKSNGGIIFTSNKLYDNQVPAWLRQHIKQYKLNITADAEAMIIQYLGNDLSKIDNEISKIAINLAAGGTITAEIVAENIGISKEYNVFALTKALSLNDVGAIYRITDYFANNPKAAPMPLVMGALYRFYSRLYAYQHIKTQTDRQVMDALGVRNSFALRELKQAGRYKNLQQTQAAIALLKEYDLKSKGMGSVGTPQGELLREMILKITHL